MHIYAPHLSNGSLHAQRGRNLCPVHAESEISMPEISEKRKWENRALSRASRNKGESVIM